MRPSIYYPKAIFIGAIIFFMLFSSKSYAQAPNNNAYQQSAEEKKLMTYINKHATDTIEMNDGKKIIGRITIETPSVIFVKCIGEDAEQKVNRSMLKNIRKPTTEELQEVKVSLKYYEIKDEPVTEVKVVEETSRKKAAEERYQEDVRSAQRARYEPDTKKSAEDRIVDAKSKGNICSGMTTYDVSGVLGMPDNKKESYKGNAKRETWYYGGAYPRTVDFYDGKVK